MRKLRPAEHHLASPLRLDLGPRRREAAASTCAGSAGAAIVATATRLGNRAGRRQHRSAAQAVADQQLRRLRARHAASAAAATRSPTLDEKLVFANSPSLAPSPVKSKRSTAMPWRRQRPRDARGREDVLRAGETVGEQGEGARRRLRQVEPRREPAAVGADEGDLLELALPALIPLSSLWLRRVAAARRYARRGNSVSPSSARPSLGSNAPRPGAMAPASPALRV